MHFLQFILQSIIVLFLCFYASYVHSSKFKYNIQEEISKTIVVDQSGHGDFTSVQEAIDSVPSNNNLWTHIQVKAGTYNEKVNIPIDKTRIFLDGESSRRTIIQWGDGGNAIESSTIQLQAENFVARQIQFKNTYNHIIPRDVNGHPIKWAPAALINADKASFYSCSFISLQDTLTDSRGRHRFENCYIEGAMDFIWGGGTSIYQKCIINATSSLLGGPTGYIAAQARNSSEDNSGFVFSFCVVIGSGSTYLGRAYGGYSRVVFYRSTLSDIIVPEGWSSWNSPEDQLVFSEAGCEGPGADTSKRVKWENKLSPEDLRQLTNTNTFINADGWLDLLPKI